MSKGDKATKENIMSHTYYTTSHYATENTEVYFTFHHYMSEDGADDTVDGYICDGATFEVISRLFSDEDVTEGSAAQAATREAMYALYQYAHGLSGETVAALAFDLLSEFQRAEF